MNENQLMVYMELMLSNPKYTVEITESFMLLEALNVFKLISLDYWRLLE